MTGLLLKAPPLPWAPLASACGRGASEDAGGQNEFAELPLKILSPSATLGLCLDARAKVKNPPCALIPSNQSSLLIDVVGSTFKVRGAYKAYLSTNENPLKKTIISKITSE